MSKEIDDLCKEVEKGANTKERTLTLIKGIVSRNEAAEVNQESRTALHAELKARADELASAVDHSDPVPKTPTLRTPFQGRREWYVQRDGIINGVNKKAGDTVSMTDAEAVEANNLAADDATKATVGRAPVG